MDFAVRLNQALRKHLPSKTSESLPPLPESSPVPKDSTLLAQPGHEVLGASLDSAASLPERAPLLQMQMLTASARRADTGARQQSFQELSLASNSVFIKREALLEKISHMKSLFQRAVCSSGLPPILVDEGPVLSEHAVRSEHARSTQSTQDSREDAIASSLANLQIQTARSEECTATKSKIEDSTRVARILKLELNSGSEHIGLTEEKVQTRAVEEPGAQIENHAGEHGAREGGSSAERSAERPKGASGAGDNSDRTKVNRRIQRKTGKHTENAHANATSGREAPKGRDGKRRRTNKSLGMFKYTEEQIATLERSYNSLDLRNKDCWNPEQCRKLTCRNKLYSWPEAEALVVPYLNRYLCCISFEPGLNKYGVKEFDRLYCTVRLNMMSAQDLRTVFMPYKILVEKFVSDSKTDARNSAREGEKTDDKTTVKLYSIMDVWYHSSYRNQYTRKVFNPFPRDHPQACDPSELNTYVGWRWTLDECETYWNDEACRAAVYYWLDHGLNIIAGGDKQQYDHLIRYFALKIQRPWNKVKLMPIIYGPQGSFKNFFLEFVSRIMAPYYKTIENPKDILDRFNGSSLKDLFIVCLDEFYLKDRSLLAMLNVLITERDVRSEEKYKPVTRTFSFIDLMAITNDVEQLRIFTSIKDRRFMFLDSNPILAQQRDLADETINIFKKFLDWPSDGVLKALFYYFSVICDIEGYNTAENPPISSLHEAIREQSIDPLTSWWQTCLYRGYTVLAEDLLDNNPERLQYLARTGGRVRDESGQFISLWVEELPKIQLYDCYRKHVKQSVLKHKMFWHKLRELCEIVTMYSRQTVSGKTISYPLIHRFQRKDGKKVKYTYVILPTLEEARKMYTERTGIEIEDHGTNAEQMQRVDNAEEIANDRNEPPTPIVEAMDWNPLNEFESQLETENYEYATMMIGSPWNEKKELE
eukprot:TRINITY_DN1037_c0_g2_i2.p1 TRINITY_DN1037_c0_g2~~TRINITY_DN1037_c0_g2_i2.p1  ORF type:complete len:934 (-),score=65.79 TRINITY_DN1037_c0_g2_i2:69-2870(-)